MRYYKVCIHALCNQEKEQTYYFWPKIAQICLLATRMATTTIYIAFYKTSFSYK